MKNLVLIGMPGAGKSTVGVVLAKQQGYHFVDSDLVIQEKTGLLLHEIIEQQGDDGFRQVENRINAELAVKHSVIATGGSVIYGREAMQHLKKIGVVLKRAIYFITCQGHMMYPSQRVWAICANAALRCGRDRRCSSFTMSVSRCTSVMRTLQWTVKTKASGRLLQRLRQDCQSDNRGSDK